MRCRNCDDEIVIDLTPIITELAVPLDAHMRRIDRAIHALKEIIVADFAALNVKLDEQDAARTAATDRITADVQALRDQIAELELDAADQAAVDAIVTRVQGNIDALNAIDPVRADEPPAEPTP